MAHRLHPSTVLALVETAPPGVVVPGIGYGFVFRTGHALFAVSILGHGGNEAFPKSEPKTFVTISLLPLRD